MFQHLATPAGNPGEGVLSLDDLREKGVSKFTISEKDVAANDHLKAYWFHSDHMTGSNFFVQKFQLFVPWYDSQRRPMEVRVIHDPGKIFNKWTFKSL